MNLDYLEIHALIILSLLALALGLVFITEVFGGELLIKIAFGLSALALFDFGAACLWFLIKNLTN